MTFAQNDMGLDIDLTDIGEKDLVKTLFSENPAIVIQLEDEKSFLQIMRKNGISFNEIGKINSHREFNLKHYSEELELNINELRDVWYQTSYYFDKNQTQNNSADSRFKNYKSQVLHYRFPENFTGKYNDYKTDKRPIAAIIREKGVNGDREMAYSLYHAGFDVKDVHMMDLISGTEDLTEVNMIVFVGGFSNSDVLGSAKGWAGAFLYNEKAKKALDNFYARKDTLSLGICNGCQLMVELNLVNPEHKNKSEMLHNESHKFESGFINVEIENNDSIMLKSLEGSRLGVWVAHGEGRFNLPELESEYSIPVKYGYSEYPANPNGSDIMLQLFALKMVAIWQ
jgi:phosphoribosylformylglycinamidine synthase